MLRVFGVLTAVALTGIAFYISRYWVFRWWPRDGLGGIELLRPQGNLVGQAVRGTPVTPFDILLWAIGVFLVLSALQAIWSRVFRG